MFRLLVLIQGGAEYIDPKMRVSTEFPAWVDKNKDKLEGKQVMMFCTGGIRCERASALLREKGLDNVYQMQGNFFITVFFIIFMLH